MLSGGGGQRHPDATQPPKSLDELVQSGALTQEKADLANAFGTFVPADSFRDDMELPAGAATLTGSALPGAAVTLTVEPPLPDGSTFSATADADGRWTLGPLKAPHNAGPFELTLACGGATVAAREVWFG